MAWVMHMYPIRCTLCSMVEAVDSVRNGEVSIEGEQLQLMAHDVRHNQAVHEVHRK